MFWTPPCCDPLSFRTPPFVGRCVRPHEAPFRVTRSPRRRRCDRRFHAWALGGLRLDADGAVAHWPGAIHSKYPLPGRLRRWRRRPGRVSGWGVLKDRTFLSDQWQVQVEEQEKSSDFLVQPTSQRSKPPVWTLLGFIMLHHASLAVDRWWFVLLSTRERPAPVHGTEYSMRGFYLGACLGMGHLDCLPTLATGLGS